MSDDLRFHDLARAYVDHYSNPRVWTDEMVYVERDNSATNWVVDSVIDLTYDEPQKLLEFVLEVLALEPPTEVVEVLSAGPLEDYLGALGEEVIGEVESLARSNPKFASLQGGVWKNKMSDSVWHRVQAVWDRRGWDGIPE